MVGFCQDEAGQAKWEPTKISSICSKHFLPDDFQRKYLRIEGQEKAWIPRLIRDDFGIAIFPRIHAEKVCKETEDKPSTSRDRRKIMRDIMNPIASTTASTCTSKVKDSGVDPAASTSSTCMSREEQLPSSSTEHEVQDIRQEPYEVSEPNVTKRTTDTHSRQIRNRVIGLQIRLKQKKKELRQEKRKHQKLVTQINNEKTVSTSKTTITTDDDPVLQYDESSEDDYSDRDECSEEGSCMTEDESMYHTENETETTTEDEEEVLETHSKRLSVEDDNLRTQPKHIVFLSQLLLLLQVCHSCRARSPLVEAKQIGTMVQVTANCTNSKCPKPHNVWCSQPNMPGTHVPAGNFLLSMAILLSGGSATKVFTMFSHMGLGCISLNTFFYHQRTKLFPTILLFWKRYQEKMLEKVKALGSSLTVAGDGRHDSMGHCAKYGAYSIFCCTLPMILYFALIQRNQAGSSPAMEYMGFQQSMEFLLGSGLCVSTFISDRHTTIACHMRKVYTNITHYFDLWHIKKKIRKVLSKISKESGCQILSDWIKPCENHFYWSATSTFSGNGSIIWAKFKSFLSHIINKHSNLDDPLFDKCHHGDIPDRKWLQSDSIVYERVNKALTQHSLVNGIKQASPYSQTSSLEGFHSVLNHFSPKMIVYSYAGQYCRHILASVHFNFNLQREIITRNDGSERVKVVWPKYKNGEATVRNVRIKPNFDYIEEIYQTFLEAKKEGQLKDAMQELTAMTPAPMNTMLEEKQTKADALEKRTARRSMTVKDVPPTAPVPEIPEPAPIIAPGQKAKPHCSTCKRPMKGHKAFLDCPKNQK